MVLVAFAMLSRQFDFVEFDVEIDRTFWKVREIFARLTAIVIKFFDLSGRSNSEIQWLARLRFCVNIDRKSDVIVLTLRGALTTLSYPMNPNPWHETHTK